MKMLVYSISENVFFAFTTTTNILVSKAHLSCVYV